MLTNAEQEKIKELKKIAKSNGWAMHEAKIVFMLALCSNNIDKEIDFFLQEAKKNTPLDSICEQIEMHINTEPD